MAPFQIRGSLGALLSIGQLFVRPPRVSPIVIVTQELPIPPVALSHRSVEMLRVWLANDKVHVSLNIGFWEDRDMDERSCYGILLADIIHHIADAHHQQYGHDTAETVSRVQQAFLAELGHSTSERIGAFVAKALRDDTV